MPRTRAMLNTPVTEHSSKKTHVTGPSSSAAAPMSASKALAKEHLSRLVPTQALPTPPATRKRKRARSRVTDSDTEEDDELPVLDASDKEESKRPVEHVKEDAVVIGNKKRRTLKLDAIAEELSRRAAEEEFWTGDSRASILPIIPKSARTLDSVATRQEERGRSRSRSRTRSPSSSPPAPHLLKRNRTGLFSPPPSRRDPRPFSRPVTPPPPPRTPEPKRKSRKAVRDSAKRLFPERDSPNNPFLADDSSAPGSSSISPERPKTAETYTEKPTITMVYRGVKHEFINPLYDPDAPNGVPSDRNSPSRLPPTDPDFSPTPYCPPKLLFPEARKLDHAKIRSRASGSPSPVPVPAVDSDNVEDEFGEYPSTPKPKRLEKSRPLARATEKPKVFKGKGKGKEKKSEWESSDEEDEDEPPVQQLRRSPRLNGRVQAAVQFPLRAGVAAGRGEKAPRVEASERVPRGERERGRPTATKDVKEAAKLAPLLFPGRE
ncbi:hypothetical protein QCA50_013692 [Cerrena zonata]|uniref:Uncharacterized protein n=1 Tax=Cerrena zonata TaxID=2478898 RepID=A0AAW0G1U8_9APHY